MNKLIHFAVLIATIIPLLIGCGASQTNKHNTGSTSKNVSVESNAEADSIGITQAFEKLKVNKAFLEDLALDGETQYSWNDDVTRIISGDLNGDGIADALVAFTVEGRGGGNNFDLHYAIFLKKNNQWTYQNQFDANAGSPDFFYGFNEIKNGIIKGAIMDNKEVQSDIPVEFILKNKSLINTYTALHKTEASEREYMSVDEILTPENVSIPLMAPRAAYQQRLGKGEITEPKQQPECGTHFDEGHYSELHYPNLIIELNNNEDGACNIVTLKGSAYKLQTDKGTLTEKTRLDELTSILNKNDSLAKFCSKKYNICRA